MPPLRGLRGLLQRRRAEREIDDELAFHVAMETDANIARGMTPEAARQAALGAFGGVVQAKETVREIRTLRIESVWLDLRYAARTLSAHWRFTIPAVAMLALGIGISTAMFTIVDALVLRPIPFADPDRLAQLWMGNERGGRIVVSPAVVHAWREAPGIEGAESAMSDTAVLEIGDIAVSRPIATVTPGLFTMLGGVEPVRGRLFTATEGRPDQADRVLVSETVWRTLYNADPSLVGRSVIVDGEHLTVVGILPAEFRFPSAHTVIWRPTQLNRQPGEMARAYVRFARGGSREDALRQATDAARAVDARNANLRARVSPLVRVPDDYSKHAVPLLGGGVVLVFFVLCSNVCGLLLARLTGRRREFGMRAAIGASRGRLMRQALVESSVLGALGVACGIAIASLLVAVAEAVLPEPLLSQTMNPLNIDRRALAVSSIVGIVATLAASLLPAWLGTRVDALESLRVVDRGGTEARGARLLTRALLVVEVSLACTLLVGATLLTRSFVNLARADRGLDASGVTTMWLSFSSAAGDAEARQTLARAIEDDVRRLPGVRQVAWSYGLPPSGGMHSEGDWVSDLADARPVNMAVDRYVVGAEFFALYKIPIVRGRSFVRSDAYTDVIVSERFAQALWPERDAVGRTFRYGTEQFHVVGLAREINHPSIDSRVNGPEFYHPYTAAAVTPMLSLRCEPRCPEAAVLRRHFTTTHAGIVVQDAGPIDRRYLAQIAQPRASAVLAVTFATIALVAAAGGLFSILSYAVTRRRREFGIRSALGASPEEIRRSVLFDGLAVGTIGLALGSVLAAALGRTLSSVQYGVTLADPLSWSIVLGVIALIIAGASWVPARAASFVDPLVLLREE